LLASSLHNSVGDIVAVFKSILLGVSNGEEEGGIFTSVQYSVLVEVKLGHDTWHLFVAVLKGLNLT